jgi:hypothetical protein
MCVIFILTEILVKMTQSIVVVPILFPLEYVVDGVDVNNIT